MATGCTINTTSTLGVPALQRRLQGVELQIIQQGAQGMVTDIRSRWIGWRYQGVPLSHRGRSRAGWQVKLTSNTQPPTITIINVAVDYGSNNRYYVDFIRRSKGAPLEWEVQIRRVQQAHLPVIAQQLTAAIQAAINQPGIPAQIRPARAGQTVRRTIV